MPELGIDWQVETEPERQKSRKGFFFMAKKVGFDPYTPRDEGENSPEMSSRIAQIALVSGKTGKKQPILGTQNKEISRDESARSEGKKLAEL